MCTVLCTWASSLRVEGKWSARCSVYCVDSTSQPNRKPDCSGGGSSGSLLATMGRIYAHPTEDLWTRTASLQISTRRPQYSRHDHARTHRRAVCQTEGSVIRKIKQYNRRARLGFFGEDD